MVTISYGLTVVQVLACWKKSRVPASMQIYAEIKYAVGETSAFSLLDSAVPYLLRNRQLPSPALAEEAACQLCQCWKTTYIFLLFSSAQ